MAEKWITALIAVLTVLWKTEGLENEKTTIGGTFPENGTISSRGFPNGYEPNGDIFTYYLINNDPGRIVLSFDDWSISPWSSIKIFLDGYNSNGTDILSYNGAQKRPFLMSVRSKLMIEFHTGMVNKTATYFPFIGFTARYQFLSTFTNVWRNKPTQVDQTYFYSVLGGSLKMVCRELNLPRLSNEWVDYIWVVLRNDQLDPAAKLLLTINQVTIMDDKGESLEIRYNGTSLSPLVLQDGGNYYRNHEYLLPNGEGVYVRLRQTCSSQQREFRASFSWVGPGEYTPDGRYKCLNESYFQCDRSNYCIPPSLTCDNVQNCPDNSDEKRPCTAQPAVGCTQYWQCLSVPTKICDDKVCDGRPDCWDGTDEQSCSSTTRYPAYPQSPDVWVPYRNYNFLSIMMPVLIVSVLLIVISCVVFSFILRRRRLQMAINRARLYSQQRALANSFQGANMEGMHINGDSDYGWPNEIMCPPSYDETMMFCNEAYASTEQRSLPAPPPYSANDRPKAEEILQPGLLPPQYSSEDNQPAILNVASDQTHT